jgi:hypothetical protein
MPRAAREPLMIPGFGGHLQVYRYIGRDDTGATSEDPADVGKLYEGSFIDVHRWRIRHEYRLADVTHSGSNGAIKRVMVAQDFEFFAELPWNSRELNPSYNGEALGFIQELLVGQALSDYNVSILFALGDSLQYGDPNRRAALHAPQVLIEEVETVNDSTGTAVVSINIRGRGNSLLRGVRGLQVQFNDLVAPAVAAPPAQV